MTIKKETIIKIIGAIIGATLGFLYWYFIGCENGCSIRSVWWRMSLWGMLMGFLLISIILDNIYKQKK